MNKLMQLSKGMIKFTRALELTNRIHGRIQKNVVNAYLKCDNIPILWKKHYSKSYTIYVVNVISIVVKVIFMILLNVIDVFDYVSFFSKNDYYICH